MDYILYVLITSSFLFIVLIAFELQDAKEVLRFQASLLDDINRNLEYIALLMTKKITKK